MGIHSLCYFRSSGKQLCTSEVPESRDGLPRGSNANSFWYVLSLLRGFGKLHSGICHGLPQRSFWVVVLYRDCSDPTEVMVLVVEGGLDVHTLQSPARPKAGVVPLPSQNSLCRLPSSLLIALGAQICQKSPVE